MQYELLLHTLLFCARASVLTAPFSHWLFYPGGYYRRPVQNRAEALHLSLPVFGMGFSLRKFDISCPIYFDISYLQTVKTQYRLWSQTDLGVSSISFISSYLMSLTVFFVCLFKLIYKMGTPVFNQQDNCGHPRRVMCLAHCLTHRASSKIHSCDCCYFHLLDFI